jgi:hypothetical protein
VHLDYGDASLIAAWLVGISSTIARIDRNLIQADLGSPRPGWEAFAPFLTQSWITFWLFVLLVGALGGAMLWYVGGWWYNVRLGWSGAVDFDRRQGRLVYTFAGLVWAIPSIAYAAIATVVFPNYQAAWESEELWSVLLLVFPFWAVVVSYLGVRSRFQVRSAPARVWFLILPIIVYTIALGIIGTLYAVFTPTSEGAAV